MPIYQYQCSECGHAMEALQKMNDPVLTDCPACKQPALRKQLTAAAFKLKGTGWYETDFKNSGKPTKDKSSTSSSDGSASDTSATTAAANGKTSNNESSSKSSDAGSSKASVN